jgi:hypothetical protein
VVGADSGHKLVINGQGALLERGFGPPLFRILQVAPGGDLTINNLTIAKGTASESPSLGGGIFNDHGTLSLTNCTVSQNSAAFGGGIYNSGGGSSGNAKLSVTNSTFRENSFDSPNLAAFSMTATLVAARR